MNPARFDASYASAFHDYVTRPDETTLRTAYELGREAVAQDLTLLDLAEVHHEALLSEISRGGEAEGVVRAAAQFLFESISAYEMVRRGFEEASRAVALDRTRLEMLRQLSNFLADSSLATASLESLEEVLRLIAEQAREFIGARLCVVTFSGEGQHLTASSYAELDGSAATETEESVPLAVSLSSDRPESRLTACLTSLDGREFGRLELFEKDQGEFTAVDEASLVHLSQLASAAVERVLLHASR